MTDILDLKGWVVLSKTQSGGEYVIEAEYTIQPTNCPKCGVVDTPYKHGVKPIKYRDSPIRGASTVILAQVQRYRCKHCRETFLQPLDGIYPDMRMTRRCVEYIQSQCLRDTFVRIAEHIGCDDKTVRALAGAYIADLNANYKPQLPEWLGIDETQIDGQLRCIITDVGNRRPVDMLPTRDKPAVTAWLYQFKDRRTVKGLAIDMWRPYKDAAQAVFPGLPVVVDKFHLVKMANKALEDIRIELAKTQPKAVGKDWMQRKSLLRLRRKKLDEKGLFNLNMWLDNTPGLKQAYEVKEAFYDIYEARSKEDAALTLDSWMDSVPANLRKGKKSFAPLLTSVKNWRTEMLAFFDYPITNGYTEAVNGVAKVVNRQGRGYSFDVLRARVLFGGKNSILQAVQEPLDSYERCYSCHGLFEKVELAHHLVPADLSLSMDNALFLCHTCHARFHTEDAIEHDSTSTP